MKTRLLIIIGIALLLPMQLVFAEPLVPEPEPESGIYPIKNQVWKDPCPEGYGLADDVCITLEEMNKNNPTCEVNPKRDFGKCNKNMSDPQISLDKVLNHCFVPGEYLLEELQWWNNEYYMDNVDCELMIRDKHRIAPPLKQVDFGIPIHEIQCKESLILVTKHDGSPACVKPETKTKLLEREWIPSSDIFEYRKTICDTHDGKWSDEFNNCVGGSMDVSCDYVTTSEFKSNDIFSKIITQDGTCISHTLFCKSMGGISACMSYEQKGHGRDICTAICEFEYIEIKRK